MRGPVAQGQAPETQGPHRSHAAPQSKESPERPEVLTDEHMAGQQGSQLEEWHMLKGSPPEGRELLEGTQRAILEGTQGAGLETLEGTRGVVAGPLDGAQLEEHQAFQGIQRGLVAWKSLEDTTVQVAAGPRPRTP